MENLLLYHKKDSEVKKYKKSISYKAKKILKLKKIVVYDEYNAVILPIEGYNTTTHRITNNKCSCQGYKKNGYCSHLLALKIYQQKKAVL